NNNDKDKPNKDKAVETGLKGLHLEEKKYLKDNKITKADAKKAANITKTQHPIFKSITVVDGGKDWDYDYTIQRTEDGAEKAEGSRKHPNQTCEDEVLERLQAEKDAICGSIPKFPNCKLALDKLKAGKKLKGSVKGVTRKDVENRMNKIQECIDKRC
ncbi:MAG: hypothetical protein WA896_15000, partial [Spirulinaceae cyanobacterium]